MLFDFLHNNIAEAEMQIPHSKTCHLLSVGLWVIIKYCYKCDHYLCIISSRMNGCTPSDSFLTDINSIEKEREFCKARPWSRIDD